MRGSRLILAAALMALSAGGAKAEEWCGYASGNNAVVECGYTTATDCESSVGKRDPDLALQSRATPLSRHPDAKSPLRRENG